MPQALAKQGERPTVVECRRETAERTSGHRGRWDLGRGWRPCARSSCGYPTTSRLAIAGFPLLPSQGCGAEAARRAHPGRAPSRDHPRRRGPGSSGSGVARAVSPAADTVLLVKDSQDLGPLLRDTIEEWNRRLVLARSGSEAMDLLAREAVARVLVDHELPPGGPGPTSLRATQNYTRSPDGRALAPRDRWRTPRSRGGAPEAFRALRPLGTGRAPTAPPLTAIATPLAAPCHFHVRDAAQHSC
jgi:CheY-like chemotaxis protein